MRFPVLLVYTDLYTEHKRYVTIGVSDNEWKLCPSESGFEDHDISSNITKAK